MGCSSDISEDEEDDNRVEDCEDKDGCEEDEDLEGEGKNDGGRQEAGPSKKNRSDVAARKRQQKEMRMTAVKACLKRRLGKPDILLPMIDDLVVYVTRCCRAWSLVFNRLLLDCLWTDGRLPAWINLDNNNVVREVLLCCALRHGRHAAAMAPTFAAIGVDRLRVQRIPSARQALFYAADTYITNLRNFMDDRVFPTVVRLFRAAFKACRLPSKKDDARDWAMHLLRGGPLPEESRLTRVSLAVTEKLLEGPHEIAGSDARRAWWGQVDDLPARERIRALWMVLREGVRWNMKGFSLAPIHTMQRKHVHVDKEIFDRYFWPRLLQTTDFKKPGRAKKATESQQDAARRAAFGECFRLNDVLTPGRRRKWQATGSFLTDGYSLVVTFVSRDEKKPKKPKRKGRKKADEAEEERRAAEARFLQGIPPDARVEYVGCDPGEVNVGCMAGFDGSGRPWVRSLKRYDYRKESGEMASVAQAAKANRRVKSFLEEMSRHTPRTAYPDVQQGYVEACWDALPPLDYVNDGPAPPSRPTVQAVEALERALGGRGVVRRRMVTYMKRRSCLDKFLSNLPVRDRNRVYLAYGAAKWQHRTGCCVPSTAFFKACQRNFGHVELVDEFRTTATIFWTGGVSDTPMRLLRTGSGVQPNWRETRGLKCSKSIRLLSLLDQGRLHDGARRMVERGTDTPVVVFSRDGNAALNIRECVARHGRPGRLCRPKQNALNPGRVYLI